MNDTLTLEPDTSAVEKPSLRDQMQSSLLLIKRIDDMSESIRLARDWLKNAGIVCAHLSAERAYVEATKLNIAADVADEIARYAANLAENIRSHAVKP